MPPIGYPGNSVSKAARAKDGGGFESAIEVAPPSGLQLVAETGFSITGNVEDLAEVTISGQDFGTKAPQRHFDRIDRYWKNGTEVVDPYAGKTDGDPLPTSFSQANAPFLGNSSVDFENWQLKNEAARRGRSLGYQLPSNPDGTIEGFGDGGFAGWPATQRDAENIYIRHWRFMLYPPTDKTLDVFDGVGAEAVLASTLVAGSTQLELAEEPRFGRYNLGIDGFEFYIQLDDGSLQRCTQVNPVVSSTVANFTPPLASTASAGNPVYNRSNSAHKELRVRDENTADGQFNAYQITGFQDSTSNYDWERLQSRPYVAWQEGVWELWEHYTVTPKLESETPEGVRFFTRINGRVVLDVKNQASLNGGLNDPPREGWPSSGCAVTLYGYEEDRPHMIPGNKFRLSDTYVDNSRRRIEIGVGSDDLYQCMPRECCPIKAWDGDITVNFNALPFTESELAQARIFIVDENDLPTLVARVQQ